MLSAFFLSNSMSVGLALHTPDFSWDALIKRASRENLLPALNHQVAALDFADLIPDDILEVFATTERLNGERNQMIMGEAIHAASLLNDIGIQPVALKGIAFLLTGVYPNPACRYLEDIDFLVPSDVLQKAIDHLYRNGYFENNSDHLVHLRHHYPGIRRTGGPHIEIHHQVGQGICHRLLPASNILANARSLIMDGATFLIPSPTHLMNHLILHSQLAHPYVDRIFPPLRALVDLAQLQKRFGESIDWSNIVKTYCQTGEAATLALHLRQVEAVLAMQVPAEMNELGLVASLRWYHRLLLNRLPALRYIDPIYLFMSVFSRRLRLVPQILSNPSSWPQVMRAVTRPEFYHNLFSV